MGVANDGGEKWKATATTQKSPIEKETVCLYFSGNTNPSLLIAFSFSFIIDHDDDDSEANNTANRRWPRERKQTQPRFWE